METEILIGQSGMRWKMKNKPEYTYEFSPELWKEFTSEEDKDGSLMSDFVDSIRKWRKGRKECKADMKKVKETLERKSKTWKFTKGYANAKGVFGKWKYKIQYKSNGKKWKKENELKRKEKESDINGQNIQSMQN